MATPIDQLPSSAAPIEFDPDQHADGDWIDYADFRMTLKEFVAYHQKALVKFARYWAQNGCEQLQEPEQWQNYLCDYCDSQSQYNVSSWPLSPEFGMDLPDPVPPAPRSAIRNLNNIPAPPASAIAATQES